MSGIFKLQASLMLLLGLLFCSEGLGDQVDGLYAHAFGDAKNQAVLFLHGGPGYNSYAFENSTAKILADRGYFVVVFDQRGCGRNVDAPTGWYTFSNSVDDVRAIATHYNLTNPIILGHSYGGSLGIKYTKKFIDYRSLILVDAPLDQQGMVKNILDRCEKFYENSGDSTDSKYIQELRSSIFGSNQYFINQELGGYVFAHTSKCGLYAPSKSNPTELALWKMLAHGPLAYLLSLTNPAPFGGLIQNDRWMTANLLPDLKNLGKKVYGIFGSDDGLFSADQLNEISTSMPAGHYQLVTAASHNIFVDQQSEFLDFIDQVATQ